MREATVIDLNPPEPSNWPRLPWLFVLSVAAIVLDIALRLWGLSVYLSPNVMGFSETEPLSWFATFPALLLPLALARRSPTRPLERLLLSGALLLAVGELLVAIESTLDSRGFVEGRSPGSLVWTVVIPTLSVLAQSVVILGSTLLARGIASAWPDRPSAHRRSAVVGLFLGPGLVGAALIVAVRPLDSGLWMAVMMFAAAYLAWAALGLSTGDAPDRGRILAALGGLAWLLSALMPGVFVFMPAGFGLLSGGSMRWDAHYALSGFGLLAIAAALALSTGRARDAGAPPADSNV